MSCTSQAYTDFSGQNLEDGAAPLWRTCDSLSVTGQRIPSASRILYLHLGGRGSRTRVNHVRYENIDRIIRAAAPLQRQ
jgi:hypothetical protein